MKHLSIIIIVVSLCVFLLSIGVYHKVPWSVLPIVASGICILCWLLFHLLCISEERDLLKEGNQYFIDTFQNIRNPISLIKTPLGAVYEGDCPEDIKKELAVALHHIGGLEQHLIALMELKRLFGNSGSLVVAEHEIGAFMRKKVSFLQSHVAGLQIPPYPSTDTSVALYGNRLIVSSLPLNKSTAWYRSICGICRKSKAWEGILIARSADI